MVSLSVLVSICMNFLLTAGCFIFIFFNEICLKFPQKVKMWLLVGTDQFMFFNSLSNTCLSTVKFDTVSFELRICFPCQLERVKRLINK